MSNKPECNHTKYNSRWAVDARGIPLCRVCVNCEEEQLAKYRPEILTGYDQSDVNEQIEEQD